MDRRPDHPSSEEDYYSSNPYITETTESTADMVVTDGYFNSRSQNMPMAMANPYITNTTEAIPDMSVTDGYFNGGRTHQELPMIIMPNEDPVKVAMPEANSVVQHRHETTDLPPQIPSRPSSQDDDAQTVYSRVSFISERSTLPPSYRSRRQSYDAENSDDEAQETSSTTSTELAPLVTDCYCGHPQCITCVANGRVIRDSNSRFGRCDWKKKLKCSRNCSSKKKMRGIKFCCCSFVLVMVTWILFGGILLRQAAHRFRESLEYYHEQEQCEDLLPGTYSEPFTIAINNGSLSSFSLSQTVVYEKPSTLSNPAQVNVDGFIVVEHATADDEIEANEVKINVEYQVTDESVLRDIDFQATNNGLNIYTNRYPSNHSLESNVCVFFKVTVKIPAPIELSEFVIDTEQLSIQLKPSLSLKVTEKAMLSSITGNIWSKAKKTSKIQEGEKYAGNPGMQARHLMIGSTTGNIRGVWGLAEHASFETKSGNVDIGVMSLHNFQEQGPTSEFSISTISGDVAVHSVSNDGTLHPFDLSLQNYITKIKTISGDIIGQYLLGSVFSVQTISGDIEASILPISPAVAGRSSEHQIVVESDNKSGRTKIGFLEATDAKVLTEPKSLLRLRRMQTVIGWLDDKRRKLFAIIQKHCDEQDKEEMGPLKSGKSAVSEGASDIEPLYVDPEDAGLASLAFFKASHYTVSGDIFLHYPSSFEGRIKATTLSGYVDIRGEDVVILKKDKGGPVGTIVEAAHGTKDSGILDIQSIDGDIKACVGERGDMAGM